MNRRRLAGIAIGAGLIFSAALANESTAQTVSMPPLSNSAPLSPSMRQRLASLKSEGVFAKLHSWQPLGALPAWALDRKQCEVAHFTPNPIISDAYRYTVIAKNTGEVLVVRSGGIAGLQEIFAQIPPPAAAPTPPAQG